MRSPWSIVHSKNGLKIIHGLWTIDHRINLTPSQHVAAHPAEKLGGYAYVGCYLLLREMVDKRGVAFAENAVTLFGCKAHIIYYPLLVSHQRVFSKDPEKTLKLRHF